MKFTELRLPGVFLVEAERHDDARGWFQRTFDLQAFGDAGLETLFLHSAFAFNAKRGTVRGLHWQVAPFEETKLVTCVRGAVHDVLVDLRETSPTYRQHLEVELSERLGRVLYVPQGVAHGYQTLSDDTLMAYQLSAKHSADHARRARFDRWPLPVTEISPQDRAASPLPKRGEGQGEGSERSERALRSESKAPLSPLTPALSPRGERGTS